MNQAIDLDSSSKNKKVILTLDLFTFFSALQKANIYRDLEL